MSIEEVLFDNGSYKICDGKSTNTNELFLTTCFLSYNASKNCSECIPLWFGNGTDLDEDDDDFDYLGGEPLSLSLAVPMGIGMYLLSLITVVGNAMVLHAIRTEKRLQTVSNMFIMSLAAADIAVGAIVMPISSLYAITGRWVFGLVVCQFWLSADYTASTASIFNLFILSVDRYWSITSPLQYLRRRTKKRALIMIGLVWMGSSLWILPIVGWTHMGVDNYRVYPPSVCETQFAENVGFKVTAACLNFYMPTCMMVYLYTRIFFEIKKRSKFEIGQCNHGRVENTSGNAGANNDSLAEEIPLSTTSRRYNGQTRHFRGLTVLAAKEDNAVEYFEGVTVTVEYADDDSSPAVQRRGRTRANREMEHSFSNQSRSTFRRKTTLKRNNTNTIVLQKEKKAARQLGVIMGAFVLCWLPYFVLFMVIAFCGDCVEPRVHTTAIWLGYINSALNPILYPLCNANFKRAFKRMLGIGNKKNSQPLNPAGRSTRRN